VDAALLAGNRDVLAQDDFQERGAEERRLPLRQAMR
jgi:hypothetical protein